MILTTVLCDRCGGTIEADRTLLETRTGPHRHARPETDLCPGCMAAFVAWLGERPAGCGESAPRAELPARIGSN